MAFIGQAVAVLATDALDQSVAFHFAQVVAQLSQGVLLGAQSEGLQKGLINLARTPAGERRPAMQEHFHQAEDAGIVNLDAGDSALPPGEGKGQALEEGEVDRDVEGLGLKGGDVRMIQRGQDLGFSLKTSQTLWILGELVGQNLDGDFAL